MPNRSSTPRAAIFGCAGTVLSADERMFFKRINPLGFILFKRNVESPEQVKALCAALRLCVGRLDAMILVDQEGGRVQRLGPPHWRAYPNAATYGRIWQNAPDRAREAAFLASRLIAEDLRDCGLNVDCLPVLDVPVAGASDVIGSRAYAHDPVVVASLGRAASLGMLAGGVLPVVKHMPGHGRATVDTHFSLPRITEPLAALERHDFAPFRRLSDMPLGMTAHVVLDAVDPDRPATQSPVVVDRIIRGHIGFQGLLMSDDLSMKALGGEFRHRAAAVLAAGCDVVLHCNGDMNEMVSVEKGIRPLDKAGQRRAARALHLISGPRGKFDRGQGNARLDELLALAA